MSGVLVACWFAVVVFWPGLMIVTVYETRNGDTAGTDRSILSLAVVSFALSIAVISVVGWVCFVAGLGFRTVLWGTLAADAALTLAAASSLARQRRAAGSGPTGRDTPRSDRPGERRRRWWGAGDCPLVPLGAFAAVASAYSGIWLSHTADTFYHLAAIRSLLLFDRALPQEIFFRTPVQFPDPTTGTWHVALALVSALSGGDDVVVWRIATVAASALVTIAFAMFARVLTGSVSAALLGTSLYLTVGNSLDFRSMALPNRVGQVLLWVAVMFVVRHARRTGIGMSGWRRRGRSIDDLAIAGLLAFGAGAVHMQQTPGLVVLLGAGVLAAAVPQLARSVRRAVPDRTQAADFDAMGFRRLASGTLVATLCGLSVFLYKARVFMGPAVEGSATQIDPAISTVIMPWGLPGVSPAFWFTAPDSVPVLATVALVAVVARWWHRDAGAALLIGGVLAAPVLGCVPYLSTVFLGPYAILRIAFLMWAVVFVAWGWALEMSLARCLGARSVPAALHLAAASLTFVLVSQHVISGEFTKPGGALSTFGSDPAFRDNVRFSRTHDRTMVWRDGIAAVSALPSDAIVLANPNTSYELAGLTGRGVVAVPPSHYPQQDWRRDGPQRLADVTRAMTAGADDASDLFSALQQYGAGYVLVDRTYDTEQVWRRFSAMPALNMIAEGSSWKLFQSLPERLEPQNIVWKAQDPSAPLARAGVSPTRLREGQSATIVMVWRVTAPAGGANHRRAKARRRGSEPAVHNLHRGGSTGIASLAGSPRLCRRSLRPGSAHD